MDSLKLKAINFLLRIVRNISLKLLHYRAKYSNGVTPNQIGNNHDAKLQNMKEKLKHIIIKDQEVIDKRWSECQKCEHLTTNEKFGKTYNRCNKCGCFMKIADTFIKIKLGNVGCPIGKWGKEIDIAKDKSANNMQPV